MPRVTAIDQVVWSLIAIALLFFGPSWLAFIGVAIAILATIYYYRDRQRS